MESIRCTVKHIRYKNEQNGYAIAHCISDGYPCGLNIIGTIPDIRENITILANGEWTVNPKYGIQFSVKSYNEELPVTAYGIEKYLGSGFIKGIGPKFAKRIVDKFGIDTFSIIESEPGRLKEVDGIGQGRIEKIVKSWTEQKGIRHIMLFLRSHDISPSLAVRIYKEYKEDSINVIKNNPYILADEMRGIGFKKADEIALKLGFDKNGYNRLRSGILYSLSSMAENGHCYYDLIKLIHYSTELLEVPECLIRNALTEMLHVSDLFSDKDSNGNTIIYLPVYYRSETGTARHLVRILNGMSSAYIDTNNIISEIENITGTEYDDIQRQAILTSIKNKITVITGGPGTGKTTTTLGIITAFKGAKKHILLAAPTGRAAKRLSETTGMEAVTIHRLLESDSFGHFKKDAEDQIEGDVLIVDECSMIDIILMNSLLRAVPNHMTVILVGDVDQLPSVGAGNVLSDIINCGCVPVVKLERIFRQAQGSKIIMNAHRINKGFEIDMSGGKGSDFFFTEEESPENAADKIVKFVSENLPKYYGADPMKDIQVLAPMKNGEAGVHMLNRKLQDALNKSDVCYRRGDSEFRLHDKVMQIKNNYETGVYNGDIGYICDINNEDQEITVDYDGRKAVYDNLHLDEIVLAYACTIHKSQGAEYPIVVMPILSSHYIMLQRNLLYTGVTRAKKVLIIVGNKNAVTMAIQKNSAKKRNSKLLDRVKSESRFYFGR